MLVYAIGTVDYDQRQGLPEGVYSTLELAKAHVAPGLAWDHSEEQACWHAQEGPGSCDPHWVIGVFVVDQFSADENVDEIIQPYTQWFSFGFDHRHEVDGHTLDHNTVVRITAIDPRSVMNEVFGSVWSFPYDERPDHPLMRDLPVFDVSVGDDGSVIVVAA